MVKGPKEDGLKTPTKRKRGSASISSTQSFAPSPLRSEDAAFTPTPEEKKVKMSGNEVALEGAYLLMGLRDA